MWKKCGSNNFINIGFTILLLCILIGFLGWWIIALVFISNSYSYGYGDDKLDKFESTTIFVCFWPLLFTALYIVTY